ncbi:MAG TPA: NAD(P)/FAD-dependent oxidoreductase, partial [Solirubrobacteraceae bacterium]|nr:NAD(P)/FAD-dependent oxidoreductase [Solirubrobacteraceae bacterium]
MADTRGHADVVVIGAGAGGLTAAAYLAALGRQVVVVDRQPVAGGQTAVFADHGYEFDIGLHYLGGFRERRPGLQALLEPLGIDLRFREQDPDGFNVLLFDNMTFAVPKGLEAYRARLKEAFPGEAAAIDRYLRRIEAAGMVGDISFPMRGVDRVSDALRYGWESRGAIPAMVTTLRRELERLRCSPRLKAVLSWPNGVYGVAPSRVPLAVHAAATMHYVHGGAWYPEGGASAVSQALVDVIGRHGGEILLDTDVSRILTSGRAVGGVQLRPGPGGTGPPFEELHAPVVVSAMDIKRTFGELLDPAVVPARVRWRVRRFRMPLSKFVVYVVLDRDLRAEGVPNHNWFVFDGDDVDAFYASMEAGRTPAQTCAFVTPTSLKDPTNPRLCRNGQTNLQVFTLAPGSHEYWGVGPNLERGERYYERKREWRDRLVRAAERAIPGFADAIAFETSASPITFERYMRFSEGSAYGIAATRSQIVV